MTLLYHPRTHLVWIARCTFSEGCPTKPSIEETDNMTVIPTQFNINVFELKPPRPGDALEPGWYWQERLQKLLRGPFSTEAEAKADCTRIGRELFGVILVPTLDALDDCESSAMLKDITEQRRE
jgi:hypothetical protein